MAQPAPEVTGRVVNGTTGQRMPSFELYVMQPGQQGMQTVKTLRTDAQGKFTVTGVPDLLQSPHVLQAEYRGVNYNHMLRPMGQPTDIELAVYETTESMDGIQVSLPHMMIRREGGLLRVDEVYQIENNSNPKKSYVSREGSFRFYLPKEMSKLDGVAISTPGSTMPVQQTPNENGDGEGYNLTNPLKPGRTQIQISYEVDYSKNHAHVPKKFYYPLELFNVFLSPEDIQVNSNLLKVSSVDAQSGFRMLSAGPLPAKTEVNIDLSGGSIRERSAMGSSAGREESVQDSGERIVLIPPAISHYKVLIIFNLCVLLAAFVGWRLTTREAGGPSKSADTSRRGGSRGKLFKQREAILDQLARLDDQWEDKTPPAAEYQKKRQSLKHQLINITRALESGGKPSH